MIIKPYINRPKFSDLKEGDIIKIGRGGDKFIIDKIHPISKDIMLKGFPGWWDIKIFYIIDDR